MKPLKVWKADRKVRKAIVVNSNSYKEVLEKGGVDIHVLFKNIGTLSIYVSAKKC